jgi:hypothetical protein
MDFLFLHPEGTAHIVHHYWQAFQEKIDGDCSVITKNKIVVVLMLVVTGTYTVSFPGSSLPCVITLLQYWTSHDQAPPGIQPSTLWWKQQISAYIDVQMALQMEHRLKKR